MTFPPALKRGDLVALVAPSSPLAGERDAESVARAVEGLGLRARVYPSCRARTACGYAAAPPEVRAEDIRAAFTDPAVDAVWCVRGGSTAWQLLPLLDYAAIRANPKPFIGFSDVTALHVALQQRCGLVTYHGPTADRVPDWDEEDFSRRSLAAALRVWERLTLENPAGEAVEVLRPGRAEGVLTGGNLSLVVSGMGTPWQIDCRGKILFLEDAGEDVYALDRMLWQLRYAGVFDDAAGVLLGAFTGWRNTYNKEYGPDSLTEDFFRDCPGPVLRNVRSAHCAPMVTLPLGAVCAVDGAAASFRRD